MRFSSPWSRFFFTSFASCFPIWMWFLTIKHKSLEDSLLKMLLRAFSIAISKSLWTIFKASCFEDSFSKVMLSVWLRREMACLIIKGELSLQMATLKISAWILSSSPVWHKGLKLTLCTVKLIRRMYASKLNLSLSPSVALAKSL